MGSHQGSSAQVKRYTRRRNSGISFSHPPPNLNSYFYKPSNPIRVQEKIDEISVDQMETWERIRQLERKIEKKRKRMAEQSANFGTKRTNAHEKNIEDLIQALSKDEAKKEVELIPNWFFDKNDSNYTVLLTIPSLACAYGGATNKYLELIYWISGNVFRTGMTTIITLLTK